VPSRRRAGVSCERLTTVGVEGFALAYVTVRRSGPQGVDFVRLPPPTRSAITVQIDEAAVTTPWSSDLDISGLS
jgi:hypothetical protein